MQQESLVVKVLLEGERGLARGRRGRGGAGVELPQGRQEQRELLNNLYLLTSLDGTWSVSVSTVYDIVCVSSSVR
jgi:hypothetical protein